MVLGLFISLFTDLVLDLGQSVRQYHHIGKRANINHINYIIKVLQTFSTNRRRKKVLKNKYLPDKTTI